jgi:4-carboxymuconolactone decarboxylase
MKALHGSALWMMMAMVFLAGYGFRSAFAQQKSGAGQRAEKLPPDVHPESLSRMPWATRDEFTTEEDRAAFDRAVAASPESVDPGESHLYGDTSYTHGNPGNGEIAGNGTRLHIPVVHTAYRTIIIHLRLKGGVEARYHELATLIGCRESGDEYDWVNHAKSSAKVLPREIVEVVRTKKDTKGLEEKDAVLIQFGRELYHQPKVSSKTFADMERLFGRRGTLSLTLTMAHYTDNAMIFRAYDQRLDPAKQRPFPDVVAMEARHP